MIMMRASSLELQSTWGRDESELELSIPNATNLIVTAPRPHHHHPCSYFMYSFFLPVIYSSVFLWSQQWRGLGGVSGKKYRMFNYDITTNYYVMSIVTLFYNRHIRAFSNAGSPFPSPSPSPFREPGLEARN